MSNVLPIDNVIRVTLSGTPSGLEETNVNNVALFTTEKPSNVDVFREYLNAKQVAADYGTSSTAYEMAVKVFSQNVNLLSGKGSLKIIPYLDAVSATQGKVETVDLTSKLAAIILVDDGDLKVTLNGTAINLTGLNFTNCTTIPDVAEILQIALPNCIVETITNDTKIRITSKKVGDDSDVVLAAYAGTGTDLSGVNYFNTAGSSATSGAAETGETLIEAIQRTDEATNYVGVMTDLEMEDATILSASSSIQSMSKIFIHHFVDTNDLAGICDDITQAANTNTHCFMYTESPQAANLAKAAYVGRAFSTNFSGSNTSTSLNLQSLVGVTVDGGLNQTNYLICKSVGVDCYVSYEGVPSIASFGENLYFDQKYTRLALKFALQAAGFNILRRTSTKVPQTELGVSILKSAYTNTLERFVKNGYIGRGLTWNSSEIFGDPEIFKENITNFGYYTYSLPVSQQAQVEREARIAPVIQCAYKEAGAIHESDVIVLVEA